MRNWYKKWHSKKLHNVFHWAIFLTIAGLFAWAIFFGIDFSANLAGDGNPVRIFYVDPGHGDDSLDGLSESAAWASGDNITSYKFQPGDKILIKKNSQLNQRLVITSSGKLTQPIVISTYGTGADPSVLGLAIIGQSHIVVEHINFTGVIGVAAEISESDNVSLRDCTFEKNRGEALSVFDSSKIRIQGNRFAENNTAQEGTGGFVIRAIRSADIQIFQNEIVKNIGSGIYLEDVDGASVAENQITENSFSGVVVVSSEDVGLEKNIIKGNGKTGGDYFGIFANSVKDMEILRNQVAAQLGGGAVWLNESRDILFAANVLYGNQQAGVVAKGLENFKFYNNTIYGLGASLTRTGLEFAEIKKGRIFNNIVFDILDYAISLQGENDIEMDYNNLRAALGIALVGKQSFLGLSEYQKQTGFGERSKSQDPGFSDIFAKDFRLTSDSELIDAGTKTDVKLDFEFVDVPQGSAPDIGAFEFVQ